MAYALLHADRPEESVQGTWEKFPVKVVKFSLQIPLYVLSDGLRNWGIRPGSVIAQSSPSTANLRGLCFREGRCCSEPSVVRRAQRLSLWGAVFWAKRESWALVITAFHPGWNPGWWLSLKVWEQKYHPTWVVIQAIKKKKKQKNPRFQGCSLRK